MLLRYTHIYFSPCSFLNVIFSSHNVRNIIFAKILNFLLTAAAVAARCLSIVQLANELRKEVLRNTVDLRNCERHCVISLQMQIATAGIIFWC